MVPGGSLLKPLDCLDVVLADALPVPVEEAGLVLTLQVAHLRRPQVIAEGLLVILLYTLSVFMAPAQIIGGIYIVLGGSLVKPFNSFGVILLNSVAVEIVKTNKILRLCMTQLCGDGKKDQRLLIILAAIIG